MPYNPNIAGSLGRSASCGKQMQPKGVMHKARADEVAMSKYFRKDWATDSFNNASENPNAPPQILDHGHRQKPVRFPLNPTPRHDRHEPHKDDRTGLTASLPQLTRPRDTVAMSNQKHADPQVLESYSGKKHNWYHPLARRNNDSLALNQGTRSWAQDIKKSKDHIGYGNGILDCGEVQGTALSTDFPDWGCGPRTVPGPYGTQGLKGDRVGRFTKPVIQNGTMRILIPNYERGPNLSIIEDYYDPDDEVKSSRNSSSRRSGSAPHSSNKGMSQTGAQLIAAPTADSLAKRDLNKPIKDEYNYALQYKSTARSASGSSCASEYGWKKEYYGRGGQFNKFGQPEFTAGISQKSNMHGGGCLVKRGYIPYSNFVETGPVIHAHA